jgi:hypothetical protein
MADSFTSSGRKLMKALGAKVVLTPAAERGSGMVRKAEELAKKHGWFMPQQFENPRTRSTTGTRPRPRSCATSPDAPRLFRERPGHGRHHHRRRPHAEVARPASR